MKATTKTRFRYLISALSLALFLGLSTDLSAQSAINTADLNGTWYEWPHESINGIKVYKTTKYLPVPGIDKQDELFSSIVISNTKDINDTKYCGYCPNKTIESIKGAFSINEINDGLELKIQYSNNSNKKLIVTSLNKKKLVIKTN